ncbi:MAG: hypothetical protein LBP40_02735 [Campylobacteraceae bacterium]|jgi:Sec-independent protein translocase protein TatA|nr:hypothetical protein [Campylobacteraceae bacterium]
MEWLIIIILVVVIFFITKKYDNEIKMLNKMIELNRGAIDESKKVKTEQKKNPAKNIGKKTKLTKDKAAKKSVPNKTKSVKTLPNG